MEEQKVVVGEFENEFYAQIAKRDLEAAGIKTNIIEEDEDYFILFSNENNGVQLLIPGTQIEKAKKILEVKFI